MCRQYEWMDWTKKLDATDDAIDAPAAPRLLVLDAKTGDSLSGSSYVHPMFIYGFGSRLGTEMVQQHQFLL